MALTTWMAGATLLGEFTVAAAAAVPSRGAPGTPSAGDTACAGVGRPGAVRATPVATPAETGTPAADAAVKTPVARAGLTITLRSETDQARPNDLTVTVLDAACAPVVDAAVTVRTQSLVMDHGVETSEARPVAPGRYVAERVAMGMEGAWRAEVTVARPNEDPVVVVFQVRLEGPNS